MSMFSLRLDSDRVVFIESVYCQLTYQAIEMGGPSLELNSMVIDGLLTRISQLWPRIPSKLFYLNDGGALPKYFVAAMAFSLRPAHNMAMDASHLVVCWFSASSPFVDSFSAIEPLKEAIWKAHANDYEY